MKNLLRAAALLGLLLVATACPRLPDERVTSGIEPTPTPTPYEDPADCRCFVVNGKKVCNSACPAGVARF